MTDTIIKSDINRMLLALLGRDELVDAWWSGQNMHFGLQTPNDVYMTGPLGRQKVFDYVASFCSGDFH